MKQISFREVSLLLLNDSFFHAGCSYCDFSYLNPPISNFTSIPDQPANRLFIAFMATKFGRYAKASFRPNPDIITAMAGGAGNAYARAGHKQTSSGCAGAPGRAAAET